MRLDNFKYLSIQIHDAQRLIRNCFPYLEILHVKAGFDGRYNNDNQWKQMIVSNMLNLRLFDLIYTFLYYSKAYSRERLANDYKSSFWNERNTVISYTESPSNQ